MKRTLLFLAALAMLLSCGKDPSGTGDNKDKEVQIAVAPTAIILEGNQTSSTFTLSCNTAWTVTTEADWITAITPSSGETADGTVITVTSTENDGDLRTTMLTVTAGKATKIILVSQSEAAGKETFGQAYLMKATILEDSKGFNMLSDGDFEDTGDQAVCGGASSWWALYSERVEGGALSGDAYVRLNHDDIDENLGFQTVCTKPNTEYTVSAWFLSNQASGNPDTYFGVRIGTGIRPINFEERLGDDFTTSWKQFSKTGNVGNNPISEAFAFGFHKEGYIISWDNVVFKRPGDTQKSYGLTNMEHVKPIYGMTGGAITSGDGCTVWDGGDGKVRFAFGKNVGDGELATRENAFGVMSSDDKIDVVKADGKVKEIIPKGSKEGGILPTAGIAAGGKQWIHYQIIRTKEFGAHLWRAWGGGLAYSEDGTTWTRSDVSFDKGGNFMQVAFLKEDGYVYMFGSHVARANEENTAVADEHYVKLARCPEAEMGTQNSWKYWNGAEWVTGENNAIPIIYTGTLGEFSVIKNQTTGRYLMIYMSLKRHAVVVRDAASPEGDWSGEHILYPLKENENIYAPSFMPASASGNTVYFVMSSAWEE